jgi:transposase
VRLRQGRLPLYSPDPAYAPKLDRVLSCLREAALTPEEVVVLFLDELGSFRWPEAGPDWVEAAPALAPQAWRAGPNNRQPRSIGALNALTGQVTSLDASMVGREKVLAFSQQVAQLYGRAKRVYVVQDNWSIHTHPEGLAALAKRPRLEPIWLPTSAPWLNPIEKLWRWLRQDVLKLPRLAGDWATLCQQVRTFLDQFAAGSHDLLRYVGVLGEGRLAPALRVA